MQFYTVLTAEKLQYTFDNAYLICRSVSQFRDEHLRSCAPVQHSYLLRVIARVALSFLTASDLIGAEIKPIDPVQIRKDDV